MKRKLLTIITLLLLLVIILTPVLSPKTTSASQTCSSCGRELTGQVGEQSELAKALNLTLCIDCWLDVLYGADVAAIALPGGGLTDHGNEYHTPDFAEVTHSHDGIYEPADPAIQAHIVSSHAPSDAQKNSDITKGEIEAKLTGEIDSHTHSGSSVAFPVGSVYLSVVSTNPNTLLGYGTWSQIAQGKMLIGLDSSDPDFDTAEEAGGSKTHTLTVSEMPAHTHDEYAPTSSKGGSVRFATDSDASGNTDSTLDTGSVGGSSPFSVMNPYFVVYIWKRVA